MTKIRIVAIRVAQHPCIAEMDTGLSAMQEFVGGLITCVSLGRGIDLWANDEGLYTCAPNRYVTAYNGFQQPIHGNMFIARSNVEGETVGLTEEQAQKWLREAKSWPILLPVPRETSPLN